MKRPSIGINRTHRGRFYLGGGGFFGLKAGKKDELKTSTSSYIP